MCFFHVEETYKCEDECEVFDSCNVLVGHTDCVPCGYECLCCVLICFYKGQETSNEEKNAWVSGILEG